MAEVEDLIEMQNHYDGRFGVRQPLHEVELKGLDIFDPQSLDTEAIEGESVPCWMLDTDYDGLCFYATQVFFPKTSAWDNLQRSLGARFDESVWSHLSGTVSEPFALGGRRRIAVKVIDERGNELMRVLDVAESHHSSLHHSAGLKPWPGMARDTCVNLSATRARAACSSAFCCACPAADNPLPSAPSRSMTVSVSDGIQA
ncbi:hypothetical protein [Rhodoblastus sp.]|uniref:hypothetical protein n=1 Tax=Rhodoblastus sp. TaxID=1962975 RepID=UPI00260DB43F|nr:hypothetical protein [Rhodoblastus sp.]